MELRDNQKKIIENKEFVDDVSDKDLSGHILNRVFAVGKVFKHVSFKQSEIKDCYFRNCKFIECDFTGTSIKNSNFRGAQYDDCKFKYSTWEHTQIDETLLDKCLPSEGNLARDLVRSLRVNFGHIGNYVAVNKAASIEVALTGQHFYNAAFSKQAYYRKKYKGSDRILHGMRFFQWKALDLLWGNGESLTRILGCGISMILICTFLLIWQHHPDPRYVLPDTLFEIIKAFLGMPTTTLLPDNYIAILTIARFLIFGLFMAVLVKRLARR